MRLVGRSSRRSFVNQLGAAGIAAPLMAKNLLASPPSSRVRHASFGAAGMAGCDLVALAAHPKLEVVCVAEVDQSRLGILGEHFAGSTVRVYRNWREMLDKEHKHLDSVSVGTPDHMHAAMAMSAMQLGLHAYIQKPLAHDIFEIRRLTETAREKKLVTQMGIQIHSSAYYRIAVEVVRSGAIGKLKEIHAWSNKKWGDHGEPPAKSDPVPATFDWDQWLGVCAPRPFVAGYYHPGNWRKRLDFGTGTFGDMGCHIFDPVFEAAALTAPISVRSEGPAPDAWNWAINAVIHYVFPGTPHTEGKTIDVHWYDGERRPPQEVCDLLGKHALPEQGSICVGAKGVMLLPHIAVPRLFPEERFKDYKLPKVPGTSHHAQFVDAILGTGKTTAPVAYSGPLTESILLGGIATRFPRRTLEWDTAGMAFQGAPEATRLLRRDYRQGWGVTGL